MILHFVVVHNFNPSRPMPAPRPPVIRVTRYDVVSSVLMAVGIALVLAMVGLIATWLATRLPKPHAAVPVELIELPGGSEDGVVGETLQLESPADPSRDANLAEVRADETEIQQMLDNVLELAEEAVNQSPRQFELDTRNAGKPGSAQGTGR